MVGDVSDVHPSNLVMKYLLTVLAIAPLCAQTAEQLEARGVSVSHILYQEKSAVRLDALPDAANGESYAVLKDSRFHNGTIAVELAGKPAANAASGARGFIGIAFRVQGNRYEYIYLRPTNGRAEDQIRRNHSTQYAAHPEFDFSRLRKESPEKYESYVDLEPGAWTKYRIVIEGTKARLFVHGSTQPCLIVNDMKLGDSTGAVALWVGPGTEGYFTNLKVTQ
ncbi:MAG TPA: hypothetical protein VG672_14315 [Bryobacteraceae bacterium]|nr:hypothetical protein [Bryobacteraceae bacterium]